MVGKEEQEEAELLDFADNLDFDAFVGHLDDVQLQETLQVSSTLQNHDCGYLACK